MNSKQKRKIRREYFRALPGVIESLEFQYRVLAGRRANPFQWARNPEDRAAYLRREIAYLRHGGKTAQGMYGQIYDISEIKFS
jgi:hypothetical protein